MRQLNSKRHPLWGLMLLGAWGFWFLVDARYQTLTSRATDLLFTVAAAIALPVLWQLRVGRTTLKALLTPGFAVAALVCGFLLTSLLLIANASFDRNTPTGAVTTLKTRTCWRYSCQLTLVGAPALPVQSATVTIEDNFSRFGGPQEGDTVFLSIKPGFLKRPWISSSSFHRVNRSQVPCAMLSRAAVYADTVAIIRMLTQGALINSDDPILACDPPLMSAAAAGQLATVDFLLRHGADPNHANPDGVTALMRAVRARSLPVVRLLLSHHANPEALASGAQSVMGMALSTGDSSIIRAIADAIPPKPHLRSSHQ
jgi:hypothetical protein